MVSKKSRLMRELTSWNFKYREACQIGDVDKQLRAKEKVNTLQNKLRKIDNRKVTDHAIVRYMERVMGINIEDLEKTILECDKIQRIERNGVVVTISRVVGDNAVGINRCL